jgi:hypothetical protein
LKAGSQPGEGIEVAPGGSLSASMGKLWPGIDELDAINREGTSGRGHQRGVLPKRGSVSSVMGTSSYAAPATRGAPMNDAPRPSCAAPRGHGGGSTRSRAA